MAYLHKNLTNSIWHAFHALQHDVNGIVAKSKLKVSLYAVLGISYRLARRLDDNLHHLPATNLVFFLFSTRFNIITPATASPSA
jgi:hypothetical protein